MDSPSKRKVEQPSGDEVDPEVSEVALATFSVEIKLHLTVDL